MNTFSWCLIFIMGLCWGSFLNVLILRTISGESIIAPPSKCPKCSTKLLWWQKIPIFSYLYLRGKCSWCKQSISLVYPIMELVGAIIFITSFIIKSSIIDSISMIFLLSFVLVLTATDIVMKKINQIHAIIAIIFAIILNRIDFINTICGIFCSVLLIYFIQYVSLKLINLKVFGDGDYYLFGIIGALAGFDKLYLYLIYLIFVQFFIILPQYINKLNNSKDYTTLKYLIIFTISCLFLNVLKQGNFWGEKLLIPIVLGIILYVSYKLFRNLKDTLKNADSLTYSPLAPAVAIICLYSLC